jgi:hypothetical protein
MDFAPQAQAMAPQIINPTVVAQAAPQVNAQKLDMNQVAVVTAPKEITQATVVANRVMAVNSPVVAQAAKVDLGSSAPALRGPTEALQPAGASVGPTQVAAVGNTIGTGTAVNLPSGSSVREGIASNRDVLGSPDGAPLANVTTRVGDGFMRGEGGNGPGGGGDSSDCTERPEVQAYIEQVRQRMYARWVVGGDVRDEKSVKLIFMLDASGSDEERARAGGRCRARPSAIRHALPSPSRRCRARASRGAS